MIRTAAGALVALIPACQSDETVAGYGAAGKTWHLTELAHKTFPARATLSFPEEGQVAGQGPCNTYSATMTVPYPWFEAGPIRSTKMACPDLNEETAYFEGLATMTQSEVLGDTLILRNDADQEMVFKANE